ncbi:GNAT family N-acetyltransferase [Actinomycetes bacterium M1A6_2h]
MRSVTAVHPLDDPVRSSLCGAHARFATWSGRIARYDSEVAGFVGHPPEMTEQDYVDLAALVGPGVEVALRGPYAPPAGWESIGAFGSVQLDGSALVVEPDSEAVVLGPQHVPAMTDLVTRTEPGPFRPRTIEMGTYLGLFDGTRLVSLAGERMHPEGWTEISAVCTDPDYRRRGLSARLVRAVGHGIRERGEVPFLHARADNYSAIAMYESLGFVLRKKSVLTLVRTPTS